MENRRPTQNITLPLTDGSQVVCTIKTPVSKLVRDVRKQQRDVLNLSEESTMLYKATTAINQRIVDAIVAGDKVAESAARADLETALEQVDSLAAEQDKLSCEIVADVINIPNAEDGSKRSAESIDWDNTNPDDLGEAIRFFLNGPKK